MFDLCKTNCIIYKDVVCNNTKIKYNIKKTSFKDIKSNFINFYKFINAPEYRSIAKKLILNYDSIAYAKNKNKIVACVMFKELIEFPNIWQLGRINVLDKYNHKGIASNLLKVIQDYIKIKNGYKILVHISSTNKIAQKFYKKNGFKKEATIKKMKLKKEDIYIYSKIID